ncbi:hypothetical protein PIIN_07590 [Serendipita indica DSM 11827]|uniref:Uncharacterized protein n=1 Tax=Serendipita indica (strain DSM 11827) TaxID=1109443 RepID=G4TQP4_SERID|nr:hypothetical protein PIIN_07590 [Serendipita indica DSM 11827]
MSKRGSLTEMEVPSLPSIWTLYLEDMLPNAQAKRKGLDNLLQTILVYLGLCLGSSMTVAQIVIQDLDTDSSRLFNLTCHISLQIFNTTVPAAGDILVDSSIPLSLSAVFIICLLMFLFFTIETFTCVLAYNGETPVAHALGLRGRKLAIAISRKQIWRRIWSIQYRMFLIFLNVGFVFVAAISISPIIGYQAALTATGTIGLAAVGIGILWLATTKILPDFFEDIRALWVAFLPGLNAEQKKEFPVIRHLRITGLQEDSILKYTLTLHHLNAWQDGIPKQINKGDLGESLNSLLKTYSLPREYPRTYTREEIQLLPLLAECAANQFISGLDYRRKEDERCSHKENEEGSISALFGDLSALKHPSHMELDIIVQLVLWRNCPLDESFRSLWEELQSGHCYITGHAFSKRLLAYALQRLRTYAITSTQAENTTFMVWVTEKVRQFCHIAYLTRHWQIPLFSELLDINEPSLTNDERLRFCSLVCGTAWFRHYLSQRNRRDNVVGILEEEGKKLPLPTYPNIPALIGCLSRNDDDQEMKVKLTRIHNIFIPKASASGNPSGGQCINSEAE